MQIPKWCKPFRLDSLDLDEGWACAPKRAGVYVVYNGKTIQRAGGPDKKGILYIGKSAVVRNRLWGLFTVYHPASWFLWTYPNMARLILNEPCNGKKKVENLVGTFNVTIAAPMAKGLLSQAERAAMHAYCLRYGELPPLNFSFPMKWLKPPSRELLRWAERMLD